MKVGSLLLYLGYQQTIFGLFGPKTDLRKIFNFGPKSRTNPLKEFYFSTNSNNIFRLIWPKIKINLNFWPNHGLTRLESEFFDFGKKKISFIVFKALQAIFSGLFGPKQGLNRWKKFEFFSYEENKFLLSSKPSLVSKIATENFFSPKKKL